MRGRKKRRAGKVRIQANTDVSRASLKTIQTFTAQFLDSSLDEYVLKVGLRRAPSAASANGCQAMDRPSLSPDRASLSPEPTNLRQLGNLAKTIAGESPSHPAWQTKLCACLLKMPAKRPRRTTCSAVKSQWCPFRPCARCLKATCRRMHRPGSFQCVPAPMDLGCGRCQHACAAHRLAGFAYLCLASKHRACAPAAHKDGACREEPCSCVEGLCGVPCRVRACGQKYLDPWLSDVLQKTRYGAMTQKTWAYLHGYATLHAESWCPVTNLCTCRQERCSNLAEEWQQAIAAGTARSWAERAKEECAVCATERARRCVVADSRPGAPDPRQAKFLEGPFVHGYNAAKYVAALLRARYVATEQKHMLVAQDMPLFQVDPDEDAGHLEARKENWLQRHDQATGGIMGLLLLLPNMPVRITPASSRTAAGSS